MQNPDRLFLAFIGISVAVAMLFMIMMLTGCEVPQSRFFVSEIVEQIIADETGLTNLQHWTEVSK